MKIYRVYSLGTGETYYFINKPKHKTLLRLLQLEVDCDDFSDAAAWFEINVIRINKQTSRKFIES